MATLVNHCSQLFRRNHHYGRTLGYWISNRSFSSREIKIDIGTDSCIAGKLWNESGKGTPIVALHGWLDNAGSWDHMASQVNKSHPFVAIDFPGCGYSTIVPSSSQFNTDWVLPVEKVREHFEWENIHVVGHSDGAAAGMLYAGTFPAFVDKLILIDQLKPDTMKADELPAAVAKSVRNKLKLFKKIHKGPPKYEYTKQVEKLVKDYDGAVTEESARTLLKRGLKQHGNGLHSVTVSPFLKGSLAMYMSMDQVIAFIKCIKCDVLVIKASDSSLYDTKENILTIIEEYKKWSRSFSFVYLSGQHHIHMNEPELIGSIINDYIVKNHVSRKYLRTSNYLEPVV